MSGFLLDTNCISEIVRILPEPRVLAWIGDSDENLLYLSVLTFGEIRKGVATLPQGKRRSGLEAWLEAELQARFSGRILPIDEPVADRCGLLAATAIHHNLTIVSRNVNDFAPTQVPVVSPWQP
jgi:predicted nucleic acid-binding protein